MIKRRKDIEVLALPSRLNRWQGILSFNQILTFYNMTDAADAGEVTREKYLARKWTE